MVSYHASHHQEQICSTKEFKACMQELAESLPITKDGKFAAHHFDAKTGKWNQDIRLEPFNPPLTSSSTIIEVGGNKFANDSLTFSKMYDSWIHIFEPVPPFYQSLEQVWHDNPKAKVYRYGLGASDRILKLSQKDLAGEATFVMESNSTDNQGMDIEIKDITKVIHNLFPRKEIDLLHVNCEGCEWEMMQRLVDANSLSKFKMIQISFHNYGEAGIGALLVPYCELHLALSKSFRHLHHVPFGWERWIHK